jgi:hypothetical protein
MPPTLQFRVRRIGRKPAATFDSPVELTQLIQYPSGAEGALPQHQLAVVDHQPPSPLVAELGTEPTNCDLRGPSFPFTGPAADSLIQALRECTASGASGSDDPASADPSPGAGGILGSAGNGDTGGGSSGDESGGSGNGTSGGLGAVGGAAGGAVGDTGAAVGGAVGGVGGSVGSAAGAGRLPSLHARNADPGFCGSQTFGERSAAHCPTMPAAIFAERQNGLGRHRGLVWSDAAPGAQIGHRPSVNILDTWPCTMTTQATWMQS